MRTLKAPAKNLWWAFKGRRFINPPLPAPVRSLLFVCLGNICRSPFAAALSARRLAEKGVVDVRCASAGISTRQSGRVPEHGCDVADATYGLSLIDHRPQTLTRELAEAFDLIVVMEAEQLAHLRAIYPDLSQRIVLLSLLDPSPVSARERYHIDDPFAQARAAYEACYQRIDRAVTRLVSSLSLRLPASHS